MTRIEVVCGFLESGKTTLIQHILEQDYIQKYRRILILQCEEGSEELNATTIKNRNILLDPIENPRKLCYALFYKIKSELNPDLIVVEYNGTWPVENILRLRLPKGCRLDRILFCADASTFELYLKNTGSKMVNQLGNADTVLFNRCGKSVATLKAAVKNSNRTASMYFYPKSTDRYLSGLFDPDAAKQENRYLKRRRVSVTVSLICVALILIRISYFFDIYATVQSIRMIFLGILMQAFPFLLIGAFVSALLQVFVPDETLVRIFTRNKWLGFPLAAVLGLFFPICDCGIVPIASRLTQKGVPLPQAMVFMLAAPAINPITILSTLYAFPGQPQYTLYRICFGILIAVAVGIILSISRTKSEDVLSTYSSVSCSCASGGCSPRHTGKRGLAESVFLMAGQEFLSMGRYIIVGSLLCSILQQLIPSSFFRSSETTVILPVLLMLLAAFFLSVCSTSNAFIGRSFLNVFPASAVLGFIVMGPMLDLSNLFMLSSVFKKRFVVRLAAVLLVVSAPVFLLLAVFLKGAVL